MKTTLTYSEIKLFKNCRKKYKNRAIDLLTLLGIEDKNLYTGTIIHNALEKYYKTSSKNQALETIPENCLLEKAMMISYFEKYPREDFEVVEVEKKFKGKIINPATKRPSMSFILEGKVDGVVKKGGEYYLLEHKTAGLISGTYLEKLWTDFQTILYSHYIEQEMEIKISGIIYNILGKSKIVQGVGETEQEYLERKQKLIKKSKTGKSSAKRKKVETNEDFYARLLKDYKEKNYFHREELYIPKAQFSNLQEELWKITKGILEAKTNDNFYKNEDYCFNYKKTCQYYQLCKSNDSEIVRENNFIISEKNPELS